MKLIDFFHQIQQLGVDVITTRDASAYLKITKTHASKLLSRLEEAQQIWRLGRGIWTLKKALTPLLIPQYLVAPFPAYISLQTALYFHGMISQIPSVIYAISLARTHIFKTPLADISIHHVNPDFYQGFERDQRTGVIMATPEKALIDLLYLSYGRNSYFQALPEIDFPSQFSEAKARKLIHLIQSKRLRTLVSKLFEALIQKS